MNNAVSVKVIENVRKNGDIKLVTNERKMNYIILEPNYHSRAFF